MSRFWSLFAVILLVGCKHDPEQATQSDGGRGQVPKGEWGASVNGLSCRIEADRSTYRVGESIVLRWYLRNQSGNTLAFSISPAVHAWLRAYDRNGVPITERIMMDEIVLPPDPIPWPGIPAGDQHDSSYSLAIRKVNLPASEWFGGADPYEGYAVEFDRVAGRSLYPIDAPGTVSLSVRLSVDEAERKRAADAGEENPWIGELESGRLQIRFFVDGMPRRQRGSVDHRP